jgi:site-specific recombinase XerD
MTFETHLRQQRLAPRTVALYMRIAARWEAAGVSPQVWLAKKLGPRTPPGTHRSYCAAAAQWCAWKGHALDRKALPRIQRRQKTGRDALSEPELQSYYDVVDTSWVDDPVYTILLLLPRTGLRVSEACELRLGAVQSRGRHLGLDLIGKGEKQRWVPLGDEARRVLREYQKTGRAAVLAQAGNDSNGWLFPSPRVHGDHVSASSVQKALREIRDGMKGYARRASPHVLRHTYATRVLANPRANLKALQTLLGHENIATTAIYAHPSADQLADIVPD